MAIMLQYRYSVSFFVIISRLNYFGRKFRKVFVEEPVEKRLGVNA